MSTPPDPVPPSSPREGLVELLLEIVARTEMGFTERFEHDAERFYQETHMLAPGKSVPAAMWSFHGEKQRQAAWDEFQSKLKAEFISTLREAAAALQVLERERDGRVPSAWSECGDGHDYSRTGKHDPNDCRFCLRHVLKKVEASELAARAEKAEATRVGGWQPIASAPKDGTEVLLTDGRYKRAGYWARRIECWSIDCVVDVPAPTHWMPLPPAPSVRGVSPSRSSGWLS
jgi:hypothetical protein